jgi:two-component system nitrogen regulation response regulator GlnG
MSDHEVWGVGEIHDGLGNDDRSKNEIGGHPSAPGRWGIQLERELDLLLNAQCSEGDPPEHSDLMDRLVREFETTLLTTALRHTRGRRIEAAQRLGIGRNTITRKIKELGIGD